jgi:hypothetical protein
MNFDRYDPGNFYDEMFQPSGEARAAVSALIERINGLSEGELSRRQQAAELALLNMGITFSVYGDESGIEKIFPFDIIPRIIAPADWQTLESGLRQRIRALNMFIGDVYDEQRVIKENVVPEDLILSCPAYRTACAGMKPPKGVWCHITGTDIIRSDDGTFLVLEDNLRCPSGVSYVLENRLIMKRVFPQVFENLHVRPVDDYPNRLLETLQCLSSRENPSIVVLTPGIYNSAYFEHSFLAQQMGVELVEGRDLVAVDDHVYMRTTKGFERVDVIYRRIDDDFIDPNVFREDSVLGVPGLMEAYKKGNVALANAPGTGVDLFVPTLRIRAWDFGFPFGGAQDKPFRTNGISHLLTAASAKRPGHLFFLLQNLIIDRIAFLNPEALLNGFASRIHGSKKEFAMSYPFRNLVFEGGGVKGLAYVGALSTLESRDILKDITRVGGTSAGAINAVLLALGYDLEATYDVLSKLNFNNFMDDSWGFVRDAKRLVNSYGWYRGDFFKDWMGNLVKEQTGNSQSTFNDLHGLGLRELYLVGTNLSTGYAEVFSPEHTPRIPIVEAVRISMSIPLFFQAVRNFRGDVYVDGGVFNNYPVKLFDRKKYIDPANQKKHARETPYYEAENKKIRANHPNSSLYVYNKETLGFRLDTQQEIAVFRDGAEPPVTKIDDFFDYALALIKAVMNVQNNAHLHSDDWQRTVYINTLDVGTTDFDLSETKKQDLLEQGKAGIAKYFEWYDSAESVLPANHPDSTE